MKIGDKVVLREYESTNKFFWGKMCVPYVGRDVLVIRIDDGDGSFEFFYDGATDWWLQSACEPVKNERYFLFSYVSGSITGNIFMKNTEGEMPSNKFLVEYLKKEHTLDTVVITNIFEFKSEQDFLDFTSNE